jgi:hypothetical protein
MAYNFINQNGNGTDYIQGTASLFTYPFTINFWFYPTISGIGTLQMFVLHNTSNNQRHVIQVNTSTTRLVYNAFTTANALATATTNYTTNAWNMATAVGTSATSRTIYLNGNNSATNTTSRAITTPTRWLAGANYVGSIGPAYEGRICEIGIWNAVLSAADIASLYRDQKASLIKPQNLKVYVPLIRDIKDEREATTAISSTISDTTIESHIRRYG